MSNPGTPGGAGFQPGVHQPSGAFSSTTSTSMAGTSTAQSGSGTNASQSASGPSGTLPFTTTPAGTAPRKQLAAAAAAGAAAGASLKPGGGRAKAPPKKGSTGGSAGTGKRGGRAGGGGGAGGGAGARGSGKSSNPGDTGDEGGGDKGKDSDDENEDEPEVSIEEQFILRLPPGEMCDRFREKVISREIDESVKLKFFDARRGTFTFEGMDFSTKLVDLPTIIEAQKTLNGKQMYKIADISQMLVVDETPMEKTAEIKKEPVSGDTSASQETASAAPILPPLKPSDYVWPDGLTNPMKNARKRRFRKRVSKVAVEGVENEIERLLQEDALAEEVIYEIKEQIEGMDRFDSDDGATPAPDGGQSDMDIDGEMMDMEDDEDEDEDDLLAELERKLEGGENSSEDEGVGGGAPNKGIAGGIGATNLHGNKIGAADGMGGAIPSHGMGVGVGSSGIGGAALIAKQGDKGKSKAAQGDEEEDDEEDEEDDEEEDDDDDDSGSEEDDEDDQAEKMLKDEIRELNAKIKDKEEELQSAPNDILKRRFGTILEKLRNELALQTMHLEKARERSKSKAK